MDFDANGPASADAGIFGLEDTAATARVVLIAVPFEATTSYGSGASEGPSAILTASHQLDLFDVETGRPYEAGIVMLDVDPKIAALNRQAKVEARKVIDETEDDLDAARQFVNASCEEVLSLVKEHASQMLSDGKIVGVVGGDHSSPLGTIIAHGEHHGDFGILHIDAHADLRKAYQGFEQSHASIMFNVLERVPEVTRLVQVAIRDLCDEEFARIESDDRIQTFFDARIGRDRLAGQLLATFDEVVDALPDRVYVSFDIDGLDPKLCPNTGTPVPGGLQFDEASILLGKVVESGRTIIGFDLTEVAPGDDEWDGNVGARILYKLIGWTLKSRGND